ncbi:MAG: protein O-mannosyl-transferase family [Kiritimatiellia bacterium]
MRVPLLFRPPRPGVSAFLCGLFAFSFYALTGSRTIQWQDSAQFTYRISSGTLWNEYGLAMVHPLHFWLGRGMIALFPGPDPWAVSLASAAGGGLAVGLLFLCVLRLSGRESAALFGALTLLWAHSFWRFSGLPEVYTLSAALMLAQGWVYLQMQDPKTGGAGWFVLFFLNGLAFSNHNLALLSLAVWGLTFLRICLRLPGAWIRILAAGLCWLLGSLPYTLILGLETLQTGDPAAVLHSALFGEGFKEQVISWLPEPRILLVSLGFMLLSFPGFSLLLAGAGLLRGDGQGAKIPRPLLWICLLQLGFFLRYNVIDQYTFLIPVYGWIALMAGLGYAGIAHPVRRNVLWILLLAQPLFYAAVPEAVRQSGVLYSVARHKPYRDDAAYLFYPWQLQERSADRLMREAFDRLGSRGILVVEDAMAVYSAAWMRQELGLKETVLILRPQDVWSLSPGERAVWIPSRSDSTPAPGWQKQGEVWVLNPPRQMPAPVRPE